MEPSWGGGGGESCCGHVLSSGLSKRSLFWAFGLGSAPHKYIYFSSVVVFAKALMQFPPVKNLLVCENDDEKRSESEGRSEEQKGGTKRGAKGRDEARSEREERDLGAWSKSNEQKHERSDERRQWVNQKTKRGGTAISETSSKVTKEARSEAIRMMG